MHVNMLSATTFLISSLFCYSTFAQTPPSISLNPPTSAPPPILSSFVSFAIEFASFPPFAGNPSSANDFSYQLLSNIAHLQGSQPVIRVGDFAILNPSQTVPLAVNTDPNSPPISLTLGPSFFESYSTWPNSTFIHDFNLASNTTAALNSLKACAALACEALRGGKLAFWELGNEPDYYKTSSRRPSSWDEQNYVNEWLDKSRVVQEAVRDACPVEAKRSEFIGLGFAGATGGLSAVTTWNDGIDQDKDIAMLTGHFYMGSATQGGITLQGTLFDHNRTTALISAQLSTWIPLALRAGLPFAFTEVNSFSNKGIPGLSNTFGAALWVLDLNLYCASQGVSRVHMQQGLNFNYGAWQPIKTPNMTIGTKAPYYGSVAVASFLGDLTRDDVTVVEVKLGTNVHEAAYAAYVSGTLARLAVIQMNEYNYETSSTGARPMATYTFQLPSSTAGRTVSVQQLMANGSNAITGITFDRVSYNWDVGGGKPVVLQNMTAERGLTVSQDGSLTVEIPWSSAAILSIA